MVRVFPLYDDNNGWQGYNVHPKGLESQNETFRKQILEYENTNLNGSFPIICRHLHQSHSLGIFYGRNPLEYSFSLVIMEIILVILATKVFRFLLKPFRQPRIVSEILGGVFVGPTMLGRSKTFKGMMLPDNADYVIRNVGVIGFMLFLFITGVKMDLTFVKRASKKHYYVALVGVITPGILSFIAGFVVRSSMDKYLSEYSSIGAVAASLAITSFPVINLILKELNLLNSEVGRYAMSVSIISDAVSLHAIVAFEAVKQGEKSAINALWYMISSIVLAAFVFTAIRRVMVWIVDRTPEGKPVEEAFVVLILVGVMVMAFLTDMFGIAIANGPLWLGLIIPDGPPLGTTLVDRCETLIMQVFMPFAFAMIGLYTDLYLMASVGWSAVTPLLIMFVTGYITKFLATVLTALFFETTWRDSLTVGLIMSLRGQVELILYVHWLDKQIIQQHSFAILIIMNLAVTGAFTPLVSLLYDPTRPYMVNKRRTVQHTPLTTELRIVLCAPDQESAGGLISLLEFSYPTTSNSFFIHALHLVELSGRAQPVFIDHEEEEEESEESVRDHNKHKPAGNEAIHIYNALKLYQEARSDFVKLHAYTTVAPRRTMYQDICGLALANKAAFIILPYCKQGFDSGQLRRHGFLPSVNSDILANAPCSVGIFYNKSHFQNPLVCPRNSMEHKANKFVILFLGGADSREALAYADRMSTNPEITLTVVRFLSQNYEGDDEMEKKLDDGVVTWFWVKNEGNERVVYREVVVQNGAETVAAIQAMNDSNEYDLWITGRNEGINPKLVEGLSEWISSDNELGLIGDYVASDDFGGDASVLVIQQQILRGEDRGGNGINCCSSQRKSILSCSSIKSWWGK